MPIRAVTFDCAQTLLSVEWRVEAFAVACAKKAGVDLPPHAADSYREIYLKRLNEFLSVNLTREPEQGRAFYERLNHDWLVGLGIDGSNSRLMLDEADDLAYGPASLLFTPYADGVAAVAEVHERGLKIAVISNWDYTLHRVLDIYGFSPYVDFALASLEEGMEKPDPQLFQLALKRLGLDPRDVLHVGDNPVDDVAGAEAVGMHAVLIDRDRTPALPNRIQSLHQVLEVLDWLD